MRALLRQAFVIIAIGFSCVVLAAANRSAPLGEATIAAPACVGKAVAPRRMIEGVAVCYQTFTTEDDALAEQERS